MSGAPFGYVRGLDALRFLGATMVVVTHLGHLPRNPASLSDRAIAMLDGGNGVTLFYVISGFLITSLIAHEVSETGRFDLKSFYIRRVLRIFPLYYLALGAYLIVNASGYQTTTPTNFAYAFSYSYNFIPRANVDSWLGSFHTLATEEHFYLLYPLLWVFVLTARRPLWPILAALALLPIVTLQLCQPLRPDYMVHRWTFNAWSPILIGCLAALAHRAWNFTRLGVWPLLAFVALFSSQLLFRHNSIQGAGFAALILWIACHQDHPVIRAISSHPFKFLGSISYGIYVWQSFVIASGPARALIDDTAPALAAIFGLAIASWFLVEKPLVALRRNVGKKPDPGPSVRMAATSPPAA